MQVHSCKKYIKRTITLLIKSSMRKLFFRRPQKIKYFTGETEMSQTKFVQYVDENKIENLY